MRYPGVRREGYSRRCGRLAGRRKEERERVEEIGESASGRGRSGPLG